MSTTHRSSGASPDIDPFGQHPARAAAGGDAEGVEARADEHVGAFRRRAEDEVAVRREAFRAVDHLLDARRFQRRDAGDGLFHVLLEMIQIVVEQAEFPVVRHIAQSVQGCGFGS